MSLPGTIFVQAPTIPEPPPVDPGREGVAIWLEGWDGSLWRLDSEESGLVLMRGARGFGMVTVEHHRDEHAILPGSTWRDARVLNREVFLPLYVFSDGSSRDWQEHNRRFWRIMRTRKTALLHVMWPDGTRRHLRVRYEKGGEEAFELDPVFYGWAKYGIYLTAEQPYWEATEPEAREWGTALPVYFFGGGTDEPTLGPPFGIAKPSTAGRTAITNPGDVEAWPVWTITGPMTSCELGVDGATISVPFSLSTGDVLVIDTRPTEQTAMLNGAVDRTPDLGNFAFAPIEPGDDVELTVLTTGTGGLVRVELTPLYEWGI
jgi:hypothetical protein